MMRCNMSNRQIMLLFFQRHHLIFGVATLLLWLGAQTVSYALSVGNSTNYSVNLDAQVTEIEVSAQKPGPSKETARPCRLTCFAETAFCSFGCSALPAGLASTNTSGPKKAVIPPIVMKVLSGISVPLDPAPPKPLV